MKLKHGTNVKFDFPMLTNGKSGLGFYSYKSSASGMKEYYKGLFEMSFEVADELIIDLTTRNNYAHCKSYLEKELGKKITKSVFQHSGYYLNSYIKKFYPEAKAFINFHFGYGLPNSKEIVITDTKCIQNIKWN